MDTSQYDSKIQAAVDEKNRLHNQMEDVIARYIQACIIFFQSEFQRVVERAITNKPQVTQALGLEKLRELKAEVKEVISRVPEIVPDHLNKDSLWEHRKPLPVGLEKETLPAFELRHKAGSKASDELHEIMGHIGQFIIKYGLDETGDQRYWERRGSSLPRYRYAVAFNNPEVNEPTTKYKELFEKYVKAHVNTINAQREKEEAIARDLWNQA